MTSNKQIVFKWIVKAAILKQVKWFIKTNLRREIQNTAGVTTKHGRCSNKTRQV